MTNTVADAGPNVTYSVEYAGRGVKGRLLVFACAAYLTLLVFLAVFRAQLAPADPLATHPLQKLQPPSLSHPLGTDELGRDVLSRLIYGSRSAVALGLGSALFGVALGTLLGLVSAQAGGFMDASVNLLLDAITALPSLVLLMAIAAVMRPTLGNLLIVLSLLVAPGIAKVVRVSAASLQNEEYVRAAIAMGAGSRHMLSRHLLPSLSAQVLALVPFSLGTVVVAEASLSFLNMSLPPPEPTWGGMLALGGRRFIESDPWLCLFPGVAIALVVLSANLLTAYAQELLACDRQP